MEIVMARGDLEPQTFVVTEDGQPPEEPFDDIFFTVKKLPTDKQALFQKRLSDDTIYETDTPGTFGFVIEPEDTDNLPYGTYGFDLEFLREGTLKKTKTGKLILTEEYTHHNNEGA